MGCQHQGSGRLHATEGECGWAHLPQAQHPPDLGCIHAKVALDGLQTGDQVEGNNYCQALS